MLIQRITIITLVQHVVDLLHIHFDTYESRDDPIFVTGTLQLGGSFAAVFMGRWSAALGAVALAVFTVAATLLAHSFWTFEPPLRAPAINAFVEHLAIVTALLLVAWLKWRAAGGRHV